MSSKLLQAKKGSDPGASTYWTSALTTGLLNQAGITSFSDCVLKESRYLQG